MPFPKYALVAAIVVLAACSDREPTAPEDFEGAPNLSHKPNHPGGKGGGGDQPAADPAIAFVNGSKLFVMNADGSNQTVLVEGEKFTLLSHPSWAPDGGSIVFAGTPAGREKGIWIVDVAVVDGTPAGSNLRKVPIDLVGSQGSPAWSPTGGTIAFTNATGPEFDRSIYVVPVTGGVPSAVYTSAPGLDPGQPDWSPDAAKLVFVEGTQDAPYRYSLLILDRATADVDTVVPLSSDFFVRFPVWSRDGDRIAYSGYAGGEPEAVYTVTPTPRATPVKLIDGAGPAWSPDDAKLLFVNPFHRLYTYEFGTGATTKIAKNGWMPDWRRNP
jgi:Tol biopolymer transport system component